MYSIACFYTMFKVMLEGCDGFHQTLESVILAKEGGGTKRTTLLTSGKTFKSDELYCQLGSRIRHT